MNANLYAAFQQPFADHADRPALVGLDGAGVTFAALDDLSARFAAALAARGVTKGARVAAQVEKSIGAVALYLGCLRLGAVYTPLNAAYTAAEIAYFIADCDPHLFVSTDGRASAAAHNAALGETPASPLWAEALACAPRADIALCDEADLAALVYTSGTTGRSKGAMLTHGNLASNARALRALWGYRADDVLYHALPIFHVHGLFIALHPTFLNGSTTIFAPRFDVEQCLQALRSATLMMGVPTFYTRLLADARLNADAVRRVRLFISGSAPLLAQTHDAFAARTGHRILERYGMTETGVITSNPLDGERIAGTVGYPLPGTQVRIVGEGGAPAAADAPGMIQVRGANVFAGYWRMPEKTAAEFDDGWFVTGDIGTMAADGRVTIVGRGKDLIISGGYNIYPKEIEEAIDALEGVIESAVVGAPDADLGEAVVAVVTRAAGAAPSEAEIAAALSARLARFKLPRRIVFLDALPRNAMGKVQKAALRERLKDAFAGSG